MKTTTTPSTKNSSRVPLRRAKLSPNDDYVSSAETNKLLSASLAARQARLQAGDMISTDEAAALCGTSRVTMNAWINKGRALGLTQIKRGFKVPNWQFEPAIWDVLNKLSIALGTTDGWALLIFLETPLGALGGKTPRVAIEQGQGERVLELAAQEGN